MPPLFPLLLLQLTAARGVRQHNAKTLATSIHFFVENDLKKYETLSWLGNQTGIQIFLVDKKFFSKLTIRSYFWFSENVTTQKASEYWRSKNPIHKTLYFPTIVKPVSEFNLDRRIVFLPMLKEFKSKRNFSGHPRRTIMLQIPTMNRSTLVEAIIGVINCIKNSSFTAKRIRITDDGACVLSVRETGSNGMERSSKGAGNYIA